MPEKSVIAEKRVYNMTPEVKERIDQIRHGIVPEGYRKAGIDIIPSDWDKSPFRQLGVIASGLVDPQKQPYSEMQHIGPDCIEKDTGRILETKSASELGLISGKFFFDSDSIVYSKIRPNLNKVCAPPFEGICSADCYSIKPTGKIEKAYLFNLMHGYNFYKRAIACSMRTGMPKINQDDLNAIAISYPQSTTEQKKIAEILSVQDKLIELEQQKIEEIIKEKRFFLEKMFPQKGKTVPEIRFKGFTDPWEQRKADSLFEPLAERNDDLLPYSKTLSVATMTYKEVGNGAADSSLANYKRLRLGDIAFEGHTSKEFRYGRFVLNDAGDGIMSPRFSALRPVSELPIQFWKHYIHYEPIMERLLVNCTKAGTMMNELVVPEFLRESLLVPSTGEQMQIGQFFTTIDTLIILHQRKLEEEKRKKKAVMQLLLTGLVRVNA